MLFYSLKFLLFLPVVFVVYWAALRSKNLKLLFLLAASYVFYMSWSWKLIVLLWLSTLIDYYAVVLMGKTADQGRRRLLLGLSIVFNLGMLSIFKYADFFLQNAAGLTHLLGVPWNIPHLDIVLPLGISFYTFETLSYTIDCYYRQTEPFESLRDYAVFISFFPHLIAGPIIRPKQFLPQLQRFRGLTREDVSIGLFYFLMGLVKKLVVSGHLSFYADRLFLYPGKYGFAASWFGVICYAGQIYCDFSGYSDMAVGLARLFAFQLPVNFRTPYLSRNIAEFWRRWHITLSSWLRDYLYIPLRGRDGSRMSVHQAIFLTMLLGGLWHGAHWTFVAWGVFHGLLLIAHRLLHGPLGDYWKPAAARFPWIVRETCSRALVFLLVCVGWVFFRAPDFATAFHVLHSMFLPWGSPSTAVPLHPLIAVALVLCHDLAAFFCETKDINVGGWVASSPVSVRVAVFAAAIMALLVLTPYTMQPFIYFQF